jgi:DNA-directed RNA polymerase specialized sigma subunit
MRKSELHLISDNGDTVTEIAGAVEAAHHWAVSMFTNIDTAPPCQCGERLAKNMEARKRDLESPRRYAYAAMHSKVRDLQKTRAANESSMPPHELDQLGVTAKSFQDDIERSILFQQLRTKLSDRDRFILILLTELDTGPKNVAHTLGISTEAATKAIQRVRQLSG